MCRTSYVGASPPGDDAARPGEVAVPSRCHGDVARVGVGRDVGEAQHGNVVRVAAIGRVVRVLTGGVSLLQLQLDCCSPH